MSEITEHFLSYTIPDDGQNTPYFWYQDRGSFELVAYGAKEFGWDVSKVHIDSPHPQNPIITVLVLHRQGDLGQELASKVSGMAIDWLAANGYIT